MSVFDTPVGGAADIRALPVIDIADLREGPTGSRATVAAQLRQACLDNGFFYISGHGIDPSLQEAIFAQSAALFAQPLATKLALDKACSSARRGYDPMGAQVLQPGTPPDLKEGFFLGLEQPVDGQFGHGPNQWPDTLPDFRRVMEAYIAAALALSTTLYRGLALSLDLPETGSTPAWPTRCRCSACCIIRRSHPAIPATPWAAANTLTSAD